jgi:hypothetical protein
VNDAYVPQHPWTSGYVLGTLIPGGLLIIAFVWWQSAPANKHPIFPRRLRKGSS